MEKKESFTKYEKARMIGARSLQIAMGAPFLIKLDDKKLEDMRYNPIEIAKMEFEEGVIPLEIFRRKPEFTEDVGRHPIAAKVEGAAPEELEGEELTKLEDEEVDEVESEESSSEEPPE